MAAAKGVASGSGAVVGAGNGAVGAGNGAKTRTLAADGGSGDATSQGGGGGGGEPRENNLGKAQSSISKDSTKTTGKAQPNQTGAL